MAKDEDEDGHTVVTRPVWGDTRIKGTFRKAENERNGLNAIAPDIHANPIERWAIAGIVEQHKYTEEDGTRQLTVRLVQVEADLTPEEAKTIRDILATAYMRRTGSGTQGTLFGDKQAEFDPTADPPAEAPAAKPAKAARPARGKAKAAEDPGADVVEAEVVDDADPAAVEVDPNAPDAPPWPGDVKFSGDREPVSVG